MNNVGASRILKNKYLIEKYLVLQKISYKIFLKNIYTYLMKYLRSRIVNENIASKISILKYLF